MNVLAFGLLAIPWLPVDVMRFEMSFERIVVFGGFVMLVRTRITCVSVDF